MSRLDERGVGNLRHLSRQCVLARLAELDLVSVTLDFDDSVLSTGRFAEGTAIGINPGQKGQRSYYPFICTIAQTRQVLDVRHRPDNVHDANGAHDFTLECIRKIREILPTCVTEARLDSAFFSDKIIFILDAEGVQFTISMPFERFAALKALIENRNRWHRLNGQCSFFKTNWKSASWRRRYRFVLVRTRNRRQCKGPVQLELFVPHEYGYDFKVIVTNKTIGAGKIFAFHHGRCAQEAIFAELESQAQIDYRKV